VKAGLKNYICTADVEPPNSIAWTGRQSIKAIDVFKINIVDAKPLSMKKIMELVKPYHARRLQKCWKHHSNQF
jgi:hypothetical protein